MHWLTSIKNVISFIIIISNYCKYQTAQELKKIVTSSMHDDSLEGIEAKIKLIDSTFDYLDKIESEFDSMKKF